MRGQSPLQSLVASPTTVGAITTLIVIVAVFLAYNANNGLPFVPVYRVSVEIPNGSRLVRNNEVRIGGSRVGVVESIEAVQPTGSLESNPPSEGNATDEEVGEGGTNAGADSTQNPDEVVARLNLKLDKTAEPLPKDSIFRVRYRSSFGLKFLDITRGEGEPAPEGFQFVGTDDGDLLTVEEAEKSENGGNGVFIQQTEFDDIGNTFDTRTRDNSRRNLLGFGTGFAGRGGSLNQAFESLNPLFRGLKPVASVLAEPATRFERLFPALGRSAAIVAPVAVQQAELFTNMAVAFGAIAEDPEALKAAISEGPPTLEAGIETLPRQRPFLAEFTALSRNLQPGIRDLRVSLPDLNKAVSTGTPVLNRSVQMNEDLRAALTQLENLVDEPGTRSSIVRLGDTFTNARNTAEWVVPAQTVCNLWNYFWTFLPEHLSERDNVGYNQRVTLINAPFGNITLGTGLPPPGDKITIPGEVETPIAGYSGLQANGKAGLLPNPADLGVFKPHELPIFHGNPASPTGQNGSDCQPGQVGYALGDARVAGQPKSNPAVGAPDLPGDRGPTTLFYEQDSTRQLKDTRVPGRQP